MTRSGYECDRRWTNAVWTACVDCRWSRSEWSCISGSRTSTAARHTRVSSHRHSSVASSPLSRSASTPRIYVYCVASSPTQWQATSTTRRSSSVSTRRLSTTPSTDSRSTTVPRPVPRYSAHTAPPFLLHSALSSQLLTRKLIVTFK